MSRFSSLPRWWKAASEQQLVQGSAPLEEANEPSMLLVAMTMVGALVCVLPLAAFLLLILSELAWERGGALILGLVVLGVSAAMLRSTRQPFANCMAIVLWGLGQALLIFYFSDALHSRGDLMLMCAALALLQMLGAWLAQVRWVQSMMGIGWIAAVLTFLLALQTELVWLMALSPDTLLLALLWLLWLRSEPGRLMQHPKSWAHPRWAVFADAAIVGVLLGVIWMNWKGALNPLTLVWEWSGIRMDEERSLVLMRILGALPVVAVLAATAWLVREWQQRGLLTAQLKYMLMLAGVLLALCAWFSPGLATVSVVAVGALLAARWRIAMLCAVTALVLLASFYYQMTWPLAIKGVGLAVLGAALLLGLLLLRKPQPVNAEGQTTEVGARKAQLVWTLLGAVLIFGLVNWDVRGKEQVIAQGQRILVPLIPVDPRSLMQGDYMALRFALPAPVEKALENINAPTAYALASVNAQGIASLQTLTQNRDAAGPGEVVLPLKQLKGRWVLVTDAYFFPEGQGDHFAHGRFGDFRVLPDGRALLVGLADGSGTAIQAQPGGSIWDHRSAAERLRDEVTQPDVAPPVQVTE